MNTALSLGVGLFPYDRWPSIEDMVRVSRRADELGFATLSIPEHMLVPKRDLLGNLNRTWYDARPCLKISYAA